MSTQDKVLFPYRVTTNWKGETHTFYTHAVSPAQAQRNATKKLADTLGVAVGHVSYVLTKTPNSVSVKLNIKEETNPVKEKQWDSESAPTR